MEVKHKCVGKPKKVVLYHKAPFKIERDPVTTRDGLQPISLNVLPSHLNPQVMKWTLQMHFRDQIRPVQAPARISGFNRLRSPTRLGAAHQRDVNRGNDFFNALGPPPARPTPRRQNGQNGHARIPNNDAAGMPNHYVDCNGVSDEGDMSYNTYEESI